MFNGVNFLQEIAAANNEENKENKDQEKPPVVCLIISCNLFESFS